MDDTAPTPKPHGPRQKGSRAYGPVKLALAIATKHADLADLFDCLRDEPIKLIRTEAGRETSEGRYQTAEDFFPRYGLMPHLAMNDIYYKAGITAQLALSSHLLDVGFPDPWCARHIGHRVAHSLAYANATGFNHHCPEMARLAAVLTPYWRWNDQSVFHYGAPKDPGFTVDEIRTLLRALLAQVRAVTGHKVMADDVV
jgi:hypothetical protein